jgi:hypothetical protein
MFSVEFEPTFPASEWLLTYTLKGATTGIELPFYIYHRGICLCSSVYNNLTYIKQVYEHVLDLTKFYGNARLSIGEFHVNKSIVQVFSFVVHTVSVSDEAYY